MKKIIFTVLLLTSVSGMAANWVYFASTSDGRKFYYDSTNISGKTVGDKGHWTWVKIIFPKLWTVKGNIDFNEKAEQWVYDCKGKSRTDDEIFYYNGSIVHTNTGIGKMNYIIPDSTAEILEKVVCR